MCKTYQTEKHFYQVSSSRLYQFTCTIDILHKVVTMSLEFHNYLCQTDFISLIVAFVLDFHVAKIRFFQIPSIEFHFLFIENKICIANIPSIEFH